MVRSQVHMNRLSAKQKLRKEELPRWTEITTDEIKALKDLWRNLYPRDFALLRQSRQIMLDTKACRSENRMRTNARKNGVRKKPLGHWSRPLTAPKKNYDTTQMECLAVVLPSFHSHHTWKAHSLRYEPITTIYVGSWTWQMQQASWQGVYCNYTDWNSTWHIGKDKEPSGRRAILI